MENYLIRVQENLYKNDEDTDLTPAEIEVKHRILLAVNHIMEHPSILDQDAAAYIASGCGGAVRQVSKMQAYRDLDFVYGIIGNMNLHSKEWYRYMVILMARKSYEVAKENKKAKDMAYAASVIGKYTRLDSVDPETMDYEQFVPPSFEPTDDVSIMEGMKVIPNLEKKRKELRERFKGEE